jgi:predicted nucleic acid-binding protein/uncharacterized protein (DUF1778 family)
MNTRRIILDTNVLYAGLYSSDGASYQVLRAIERGDIQIVLSPTLLFEYEEILYRNQAELGLSGQHIEAILDNLCALSDHQQIYYLWRAFLPDPKDDHMANDSQRISQGGSMSALSLRLPNSIHRHIKEIAQQEGVSINQFISSAVAEKISAIMTEDYLQTRAARAERSDLKTILDNIPHRKPLPGDEL